MNSGEQSTLQRCLLYFPLGLLQRQVPQSSASIYWAHELRNIMLTAKKYDITDQSNEGSEGCDIKVCEKKNRDILHEV